MSFLDFLFVDIGLVIEIDGSQHYRNIESIEHDIKRDEYLNLNGLKVYRIKWSDVCKNADYEINEMISFIDNINNLITLLDSQTFVADYTITQTSTVAVLDTQSNTQDVSYTQFDTVTVSDTQNIYLEIPITLTNSILFTDSHEIVNNIFEESVFSRR